MKQLLFLLLLPCLAMAQYPGNAGQKITLGEQTTADGLVYRGLAADTTRKPSVDTMAFILLDTNTNIIWQYKKAVNNAWTRVGGSISSGVTGVLPVANGGTNATTLTLNKVMVGNGTSGVLTPTELHWNNTLKRLGINITSPAEELEVLGSFRAIENDRTRFTNTDIVHNNIVDESGDFVGLTQRIYGKDATQLVFGDSAKNNGYLWFFQQTSPVGSFNIGHNGNGNVNFISSATKRMTLTGAGNFGIGTTTPQSGYRLHVIDSVYVGGRVSAAGYTTRSDYDLKDEIQTLNYGLNEVIQMQPVKYTYKSNGEQQLGFIAQDIGTLIPESVHFDEFMGVDYQSIIPILTKAIQEQQALIKALEQRILILENK